MNAAHQQVDVAGVEEVIGLVQAATDALIERIGDDRVDGLGHAQAMTVSGLLRFAAKLRAEHPDQRLDAVVDRLADLYGRTAALQPEPMVQILRRFALEGATWPTETAQRLIRETEAPSKRIYGEEAQLLREANALFEARQLEVAADQLDKGEREAQERRERAAAMRQRAQELRQGIGHG